MLSLLDEPPGVNAFPIFDSRDSSGTVAGFSPIKITGGSDSDTICLPSLCAARHSQGGTTTESAHIPFFCCFATPSNFTQSEQNFSLQYLVYTHA
jgi:hypothetical protein